MIAGAFALLKQLFHVFKIMTGDQNPGVVAHAQIHRCDFGIAVAGGIGLIKIAAVTDGRFQGIALGNRCLDQANEAGIIKVGVGNGGKKALADEQSSGRIQLVLFLGFFGDNRLSFQGIDQQIL